MTKEKTGIRTFRPAQYVDEIKTEEMQEFVHTIGDMIRLDIAESVAAGGKSHGSDFLKKFAPKGETEPETVGQVVARHLDNMNRRQRRKLLRDVLFRDDRGRMLSQSARRVRTKKFAPKSKSHIFDRLDFVPRLVPLVKPNKPIKQNDIVSWQAHWNGVIEAINDGSDGISFPGNSTPGTPPPFTKLELRVHEVICDDDTNEINKDEVAIAGVDYAAPTDDNPDPNVPIQVRKFPQFDVGDFKTGDRRAYNPPNEVTSFSLSNYSFPHQFGVNLVLAEVDQGGLSQFIEDLYVAIQVSITAIVTAVGVAIGASIGAGIAAGTLGGSVAGPVGRAYRRGFGRYHCRCRCGHCRIAARRYFCARVVVFGNAERNGRL